MWEKGWRKQIWQDLDQELDILVIGGGITGAGIFHRAVKEGYRVLLVEAGDFASGTSSNSSKLIHGGIRYLRNRQYNMSRESVREREWLLKDAEKLVTPLGFIMPCPPDRKTANQFALGVVIYDLLAPKWKHSSLSRQEIVSMCPPLDTPKLTHGFIYYDAEMDDARVVLRLIRETVADGGTAINYTKEKSLLRTQGGRVCGAVLQDISDSALGDFELKAKVVINATGPWSDEVRSELGASARLRKVRGSHLVFARSRLNIPHAVSLLHPDDHRAMFAIPWEGCTLFGTTDQDHKYPFSSGEPFTTPEEIDYLLKAANATFPSLHLEQEDVLSTFSGVRPVINTGIADPSKESRRHIVFEEEGLVTVVGGKFTTFRIMAEDALRKALLQLPSQVDLNKRKRYFNPLPEMKANGRVLSSELSYILGRYGNETSALLDCAHDNENQPILNLPNLWSEIRWAARTGGVEHLDDLLLRRVRLGILLPDGASSVMERVQSIAQPELGWNESRWAEEALRYRKIYERAYSSSPLGF